tara:strand:- start:192 stop:677 length:486 start_codon:yes stop_codon:yes gene_type:complete
MLDTSLARTFAALMATKKELEERVSQINSELKGLEQPLLTNMINEGVDSLPVTHELGKSTIYVHSQIWAKAKSSKEDACEALKSVGLHEFVKEGFNTSTVSAYVREELKEGNELPQAVKDAFKVDESVSLRARRASNSGPSDREVASQTLKTQNQGNNSNG